MTTGIQGAGVPEHGVGVVDAVDAAAAAAGVGGVGCERGVAVLGSSPRTASLDGRGTYLGRRACWGNSPGSAAIIAGRPDIWRGTLLARWCSSKFNRMFLQISLPVKLDEASPSAPSPPPVMFRGHPPSSPTRIEPARASRSPGQPVSSRHAFFTDLHHWELHDLSHDLLHRQPHPGAGV
jgi:hypothetical protein